MAQPLKVDKAKFEAVLSRLVQTPPMKRQEAKTGQKKAAKVIPPK
jgi:hypothetical protein